ncbi:MAG: hypothetical protein HW389_3524, partial [Bacteroidetes bacterium]|nr:hypothetical protein [Bacteroidota bacterium]
METTISPPKLPSITIIGWTTVIASVIMIVVNVMSLLTYSMLDSLDMSLNTPLLSQLLPQSMKKVVDLYRYSRWWTAYGIFYFAFVLVAGIQFLRLQAWGRKALEIACWIALLNALVDSALSYMIWENMQETLSMALRSLGGGQYSSINSLGLTTIVVGFFLWIIPSGAMIVYLRRPKIVQAVNLTSALAAGWLVDRLRWPYLSAVALATIGIAMLALGVFVDALDFTSYAAVTLA